jgi:ParB family chromosome partitioning protein
MKISNAKIRTPETLHVIAEESPFLRTNILTDNLRGEFLKVPISNLRPYKNQARTLFDESELRPLANTIKKHGIRQPLTVIIIPDNPGFYEVISGERRLRAAELIGLERVPCIILENEKNAEEVALIENIQRKDLHPIELSNAILKLFKTEKYGSHEEMASALGFARSKITELISISEIPEEIKDTLLKMGHVSRKFLRKLLSQNSIEEMKNLIGLNQEQKASAEVGVYKKTKHSKKPVLLRISSGESGLEMFTSKLYFLDSNKKEKLKELLTEFIKSL